MGVVIKSEKKFTSLVPPKEPKGKKGAEMAMPEFTPQGPTLYINGVEVAGLAGKAVGQEFTATIKGKLVSVSQRDSTRGGKSHSYDVEVTGISFDK